MEDDMSDRNIEQAQQEMIEKFELFEDWTERYQVLVSMGKKLQDFPEEKKTDENFIKGCQSQVWFDIWMEGDRMRFRGISDAAIVSGLIAVLMQVYDNQTPEDIVNTPAHFVDDIGFEGHLSPTRNSGLYSMLRALKLRAQAELS